MMHCWLLVSLMSTRRPRSFSANLLSSQPVPRLFWHRGLLLPRGRTLHFPLLNFIRFLLAHFSSRPGASLQQHNQLVHQPLFLVVYLQIWEGCTLSHHTGHLWRFWTVWAPTLASAMANTTSVWPPAGLCATDRNSEPGSAAHFQSISLSPLSSTYFVICLQGYYRRQWQKLCRRQDNLHPLPSLHPLS